MASSSDVLRGNTDTIILNILRKGDSYGYEIAKMIQDASSGQVEITEATVYIAFRRMEKDGLIRSYWGEGSGGARRRYYSITPHGREVYAFRAAEWVELNKTLNTLILGGNNDDKQV